MQYLDAISKTTGWSLFISKANHSISQESKSITRLVMLKKLNGSMETYKTFKNTHLKKGVLFTIGDWNVKAGSQEIPGITGKFGLEVQNEAGQRLIEFCQENALVIAKPSPTTQEMTLHMEMTRSSIPKSD